MTATPTMNTVRQNQDADLANLDVATDVTVGGTLSVTGVFTAAGGVTADVTGDVTGTLIGGQQDDVTAITGDGAVAVAPGTTVLSKGSAAAITLAAPTATTHDGYIVRVVAISAQAHVITNSTVGFNAKGSSGTLTFGGAIGDSVTLLAYQGNWYTLELVNVTPA